MLIEKYCHLFEGITTGKFSVTTEKLKHFIESQKPSFEPKTNGACRVYIV